MTGVAVELLPALPAPQDTPDPDAIILVADTDKLMTMCSCAASSNNPY
jgi:CDGSH-type Zn-finger protein